MKNCPGCLPGSTFVYSMVFKLDRLQFLSLAEKMIPHELGLGGLDVITWVSYSRTRETSIASVMYNLTQLPYLNFKGFNRSTHISRTCFSRCSNFINVLVSIVTPSILLIDEFAHRFFRRLSLFLERRISIIPLIESRSSRSKLTLRI